METFHRIFHIAAQPQSLLLRLGETPENLSGRIVFMSMFNDNSWGSKDNKKKCESYAQLVSPFAKNYRGRTMVISRFLFKRKIGTLSVEIVNKVNGNSQKADTQSSEPQVPCPEVSFRASAVENCGSTIVPTRERLQLFFAQLLLQISSVFTGQSQKCVKNMNPITREDPL